MAISRVWKADSRPDRSRVARTPIWPLFIAVLLIFPRGLAAQPKPAKALSSEEVFQRFASAVLYITCDLIDGGSGQASGVIVSSDGFVVTNAHVVQDSQRILGYYIKEGKSIAFLARIKYYDRLSDTAVLKIDVPSGVHVDCIELSLRPPRVGEHVIAIGNPQGYNQTISEGIVSALRERDGYAEVQHTAPISMGSSGGALINSDGRLLGIQKSTILESQNLNFGVPASILEGALRLARANPQFLSFDRPAEEIHPPPPEEKSSAPQSKLDALKEFLSRNYIGAMQDAEQSIAADGDKGGNYALIAASLYQLGRNDDAAVYLNQALALLTSDDAYRQTMLYYRLILLTDGKHQAADLRAQIEQTANMFLASKNPVLGVSDPEARQWAANVLASLRAEDAARVGPLDNDAIVKMVAGGEREDAVIRAIDSRQGKYVLAPNAVLLLRRAGVPQGVIAAMSAKMSAQR